MHKKPLNARSLEVVMVVLIALFSLGGIALFIQTIMLPVYDPLYIVFVVIIELLIITITTLFILLFVGIKIWEQHIIPYYVHRIHHEKKEK